MEPRLLSQRGAWHGNIKVAKAGKIDKTFFARTICTNLRDHRDPLAVPEEKRKTRRAQSCKAGARAYRRLVVEPRLLSPRGAWHGTIKVAKAGKIDKTFFARTICNNLRDHRDPLAVPEEKRKTRRAQR